MLNGSEMRNDFGVNVFIKIAVNRQGRAGEGEARMLIRVAMAATPQERMLPVHRHALKRGFVLRVAWFTGSGSAGRSSQILRLCSKVCFACCCST